MADPARLTITRPDDWHLHLRDGTGMASVLAHTAARFGRAIVMPNLRPPVTTASQAGAYRSRILAALPAGVDFEPLMTLYLTDRTSAEELERAKDTGFIRGVKLYPAGATTNSESGVTDLAHVQEALEAMARLGIPLLVHGEVTGAEVDIFDRERVFLEQVLAPLLERLPDLKVVVEHATTREAVAFVRSAGANVAATITPQHLLLNRNHLLAGGIRPHHYCLPVLKREAHRAALMEAAVDHDRFFLGTDSAPHPRQAKETACGCAGVFSAHAAIELYAEAFDSVGALDRLDAFAGRRGPAFYGLAPNGSQITLVREPWTVPESYPFGDDVVVPMRAGESVAWQFAAAD